MFNRMTNKRVGNLAERAWLDWLAQDDAMQQADYKMYREYYDGKHNVPLTDRQKEYLELNGVDFRVNFLKLPISVLVQRLNVIGFEGDGALGGEDGLLWQWWQANRMDALQRIVHRCGARDGDTYAIVEWDNEAGIPRIIQENAYDGQYGVKVTYSNQRRVPAIASRRWREVAPGGDVIRRLNIYTPDAVEKYYDTGEDGLNWQPYKDEGDWRVSWVDGQGQPLGVPVFHARHDDDGGNWGLSELDNIIPVQQALNKSVLDLLEGADKTAFQIITLTGGKASTLTVEPRKVLYHPQPDAEWGYIPAGDIEKLIRLKNDFITTIAQLSQVPLAYFQITGQVASAETQKADDTGLVSKAQDQAVAYGNFWEDVMSYAAKLASSFGGVSIPDDARIETVWGSHERVDKHTSDKTQAETYSLKAETFERLINSGVERQTAAILSGYTEEEAEKMGTAVRDRILPTNQL